MVGQFANRSENAKPIGFIVAVPKNFDASQRSIQRRVALAKVFWLILVEFGKFLPRKIFVYRSAPHVAKKILDIIKTVC